MLLGSHGGGAEQYSRITGQFRPELASNFISFHFFAQVILYFASVYPLLYIIVIFKILLWDVFSFKDAHPAETLLVTTATHNWKTLLVHDQTSLLSLKTCAFIFLSVLLVMMHGCVPIFFKHKLFRVTNIRSNFLFSLHLCSSTYVVQSAAQKVIYPW